MKKFIFMMIAMFTLAISSIAQDTNNYVGSSKFTDNWSITLQGGVVTPFDHFFKDGSTTPIVVLGADKYLNPWLGVGVDARTSIGTGSNYNTHTAFDMVNLNGYVKFNILNAIKFDGTRRLFEPVVYTGLGWGHVNCGDYKNVEFAATHTTAARNYLTYRAGAELNFNLGKDKAWSVVVNPSVVWGDNCNGRLVKTNGNFEVTAGIVYRFKSSNGKRVQSVSPVPVLVAQVASLQAQVEDLKNKPASVVEVIKEVPVTTNAVVVQDTWAVMFPYNSYELTEKSKETLNKIGENSVVTVNGYASREPKSNENYNLILSTRRANAVKKYLEERGVKVAEAVGHGCDDEFGRVVVVTYKK